jgi:hypothetical protein
MRPAAVMLGLTLFWQFRFRMTLLYPKLSKEQEKKMMEKKLKQLEQQNKQRRRRSSAPSPSIGTPTV